MIDAYTVLFTCIMLSYVNTHTYTYSPWSAIDIPESYIMFIRVFAYLQDFIKPSWLTKSKSKENCILRIETTTEA